MRVLHVIAYFAPAFRYGGPPRSVLALCRAQIALGADVEVFTTTADGPRELPASGPAGDRVDGVPVRYFPRSFPRRVFAATGLDAALAASAGRFDVVHAHGCWTAPVWMAGRRARRAGVPYVVSPRGMLDAIALGHHGARKRLAYRAIERRHLARAAMLLASSRAEADGLARLALGVPIATVPNAVQVAACPPSAGAALRRRLGIDDGAPIIAFLGRLHPVKRLDLIAAALPRVLAVHPSARLVVAGPDERGHRATAEPLFAAARAAVRFAGALGDVEVAALLAESRALVSASDAESFGMSVAEAMVAGVPVVVTRPGPWDEIESSGAGVCVPQTADAIARGLVDLLGDAARARAMGARGRVRARAIYAPEAVARAALDRYEAARGAGRAPARIA